MTIIRHSEQVMGTVVSFDIRTTDVGELDTRRGLRQACATLHRADAVFSTWKTDSPLSRLRRGEITLDDDSPAEVTEVLRCCSYARLVSRGWFDPWAMPGGVDPTGMVKGWAAQRARADLQEAGVTAAMVNAGGDMAVCGRPEPGRPWRVGIRDPFDRSRCLCVITPEAAVATSGTYERGAHVLDPHTRRPARGAVSATVVGPDLGLADALATGLLAAGGAGMGAVVTEPGYSAMVVDADGARRSSADFPVAA